jgi:hypothetical protein
MKTIIKLTPEWVLTQLAESNFPCGDGNIIVYTLEPSNAAWIQLALDTLNIIYNINDYDHGDNRVLRGFDFSIEDLKSECPTLYKKFKEMDEEYRNLPN